MKPNCPICGSNRFGVYNSRPLASCLNCRSLERGRLQYIILRRIGLPKPESRVLHVAPEPWLHKILQAVCGTKYHPCDFDPDNHNYQRLGGRIFEIDLCRDVFRFPSSAFDMIIHNHVLEHIPCDVGDVLKEHMRILAPGGTLIFSVPFRGLKTDEDMSSTLSHEERIRRFGQADHMRIFGAVDFSNLLHDIFGRNLYYDVASLWSDDQLAQWAIPPEYTKQLSGVSNFVWHKPGEAFEGALEANSATEVSCSVPSGEENDDPLKLTNDMRICLTDDSIWPK